MFFLIYRFICGKRESLNLYPLPAIADSLTWDCLQIDVRQQALSTARTPDGSSCFALHQEVTISGTSSWTWIDWSVQLGKNSKEPCTWHVPGLDTAGKQAPSSMSTAWKTLLIKTGVKSSTPSDHGHGNPPDDFKCASSTMCECVCLKPGDGVLRWR